MMTPQRQAVWPVRHKGALLALGVVVLGLAGCGGGKGMEDMTCPRVVVLPEASERTTPLTTDAAAVQYYVRVSNIVNECDIDDGTVTSRIAVGLRGRKGEGVPAQKLTVPVLIVATETDTQVLSRQLADATFDWEDGGNETFATLEIDDIEIEVAEGKRAWNYEIVVGLSLTPEEVEFNRKNMR